MKLKYYNGDLSISILVSLFSLHLYMLGRYIISEASDTLILDVEIIMRCQLRVSLYYL